MDGGTIASLTGSVVMVVAAILTFIATRGKTQTDAKTELDKRIDARVKLELEDRWKEIDTLKATVEEQGETIKRQEAEIDALKEDAQRRSGAWGRILRAVAAQWPTPEGPNLDPLDIQVVEDTIPPAWIRRRMEDAQRKPPPTPQW